jgi:hypothetical protein
VEEDLELEQEKQELRQDMVNKINEIGVSDFWIEKTCLDSQFGVIVCLNLKNGEELMFTQYFSLKPEFEQPTVEIFKDGNSSEYYEF